MGGGSGNDSQKECGLTQLLIFVAAICSGTACSLCSKVMMELHSVGMTGQNELFEKPLFQTFGMFIGMTFGIVMHWVVLYFRIPFPGYEHGDDAGADGGLLDGDVECANGGPNETDPLMKGTKTTNGHNGSNGYTNGTSGTNGAIHHDFGTEKSQELPKPSSSEDKTPLWMYFYLAIPSIFDLGATALCMMGLRYLDVSIYQMLRGSGIIFVAILKVHVLGDPLYKYQWTGVFWNVLSVFIVGLTAMLATTTPENADGNVGAGDAFLGVGFMLAGAFVQALQFVFEEKVMCDDDIPVSPLLLIGMEGVWGTLLCLVVVYPIAYLIPGSDHGSFESLYNTFVMIQNSTVVQVSFVVYFFTIFAYNLFAVLVTFMLSSVWHAILDNFRPITVWGVDLIIYYLITSKQYGEPWTNWSYLQLVGMAVLLFGTAVYNAPNAGSIKLQGPFWSALGMDFTEEYYEVEAERVEAELDAKWDEARERFRDVRSNSSFIGERSPMITAHTQALSELTMRKM